MTNGVKEEVSTRPQETWRAAFVDQDDGGPLKGGVKVNPEVKHDVCPNQPETPAFPAWPNLLADCLSRPRLDATPVVRPPLQWHGLRQVGAA